MHLIGKLLVVPLALCALLCAAVVAGGVVVIATETGTGTPTGDLGTVHGLAVPWSWRLVEQQAVQTCPGLSWEVLGALGWVVDGSGRRPVNVDPPWWGFAGGPFGVVAQLSSARRSLGAQAISAAHELCGAMHLTGSLPAAIQAITGSPKAPLEIEVVATSLVATPALSAGRAGVVDFAARAIGLPYQWGGNGPNSYDCSGLVVAAFHSVGVALPRTAQEQFDVSEPVSTSVPGDLVFFGDGASDVEHVGIVIGDSLMIDAPHTGAFVRIENSGWSDLVQERSAS